LVFSREGKGTILEGKEGKAGKELKKGKGRSLRKGKRGKDALGKGREEGKTTRWERSLLEACSRLQIAGPISPSLPSKPTQFHNFKLKYRMWQYRRIAWGLRFLLQISFGASIFKIKFPKSTF
jgi:hypothetical protein